MGNTYTLITFDDTIVLPNDIRYLILEALKAKGVDEVPSQLEDLMDLYLSAFVSTDPKAKRLANEVLFEIQTYLRNHANISLEFSREFMMRHEETQEAMRTFAEVQHWMRDLMAKLKRGELTPDGVIPMIKARVDKCLSVLEHLTLDEREQLNKLFKLCQVQTLETARENKRVEKQVASLPSPPGHEVVIQK